MTVRSPVTEFAGGTPAGPATAPTLLVDAREAARLLRISERTLFTLRKRGEVPAVPIAGRVLYDPCDLRRYIDLRKTIAYPVAVGDAVDGGAA